MIINQLDTIVNSVPIGQSDRFFRLIEIAPSSYSSSSYSRFFSTVTEDGPRLYLSSFFSGNEKNKADDHVVEAGCGKKDEKLSGALCSIGEFLRFYRFQQFDLL